MNKNRFKVNKSEPKKSSLNKKKFIESTKNVSIQKISEVHRIKSEQKKKIIESKSEQLKCFSEQK